MIGHILLIVRESLRAVRLCYRGGKAIAKENSRREHASEQHGANGHTNGRNNSRRRKNNGAPKKRRNNQKQGTNGDVAGHATVPNEAVVEPEAVVPTLAPAANPA